MSCGAAPRTRGCSGSRRRGERYRDAVTSEPRKTQNKNPPSTFSCSKLIVICAFYRSLARSSPDSHPEEGEKITCSATAVILITKSRHQAVAVVGPFNGSGSKGSIFLRNLIVGQGGICHGRERKRRLAASSPSRPAAASRLQWDWKSYQHRQSSLHSAELVERQTGECCSSAEGKNHNNNKTLRQSGLESPPKKEK